MIVDKLITLKQNIEGSLPKSRVIISKLIVRTDKTKENTTIRKMNRLIKELQIQTVDNSNISEKHLGKRGLHLNQEGNTVFASNLLYAVRNLWNNIDNDFVCNDNLLNVKSNEKNFQQQTKSATVDEIGKNIESEGTALSRLRNMYLKNPIIGYVNINYFENKVINFREICHKATNIICADETKLYSFYPDYQFHIDGYQFSPFRRDRNKYGGGKIV